MSGSNALQITDPNADNPLAQAPSWADAAQSVAGTVGSGVDALGQWLAAQRAKSSQMGLWNDQTGLPTGKGLVSAAQQTGNALLMGTTAPGIRAFHASPYDFERFDTSKIGTGQGAQSFGHGLYTAESPAVSGGGGQYDLEFTAKNLGKPDLNQQESSILMGLRAGKSDLDLLREQAQMGSSFEEAQAAIDRVKAAKAHIYEVGINADPEQFLHWDKPLSEQPAVAEKMQPLLQDWYEHNAAATGASQADMEKMLTGKLAYETLSHPSTNMSASLPLRQATATEAMANAGIPGIRYLDQGSRGVPPTSYQIRSKDFTSGIYDNRASLERQLPGYQKQFPDAQIHEIQNSPTHNYVVFDANTIDILRKYGLAGLGLGLGAAATNGSQQQPPMAQ